MLNIANFPEDANTKDLPGARLWKIRPNRCRWPLSDDPSDGPHFRFCGARTISEKSSWCAWHHRLAFRPRGLPESSREVPRSAPQRIFAEAAE